MMRKLLLFCILTFLMFPAFAADFYWVGGAGSWSDLNHWASTSGGPANKSIVPGSGDDVYFDANSGLANGTIVTMPATVPAYCRNISWAGVTSTAIFRNTGGQPLLVYGNMVLSATMRYDIRTISFTGNSNATLRMNGASLYPASGGQNILETNKTGGSLTLLDGIPAGLGVSYVTLTAGLLNMSGHTHAFQYLTSVNATPRSLDISNATLQISLSWDFRGANGTVNATGSSISAQFFHSDNYTFPKVDFTGIAAAGININNTTFGELTFSNAAAPSGSVRIGTNNTVNRLEYKGGGFMGSGNVVNRLILAPSKGYTFSGNNTVNELMQLNTPDCDGLAELTGAAANATIAFGAGATVDIRNVYIKSLTAAGSITPITVVGADGGGNSGWNFQPRASGTTLYWVGGSGEWNDKNHWSATSGGTGGACVPFTGDNVVFDANSGFAAGNNTVSVTGNAWCHNMTWTNVAASPVLSQTGGTTLEIWGSVVLHPTLTINNGNLVLRGTEASTITTNGCGSGIMGLNIAKENVSGGLTFLDNVTFPGLNVVLSSGQMSMAGRTIDINLFNSASSLGRIIDITNATITVNFWNLGAVNVTWTGNAAGSFITSKRGFTVNGLTYPKVHCNTTQHEVSIRNTTIGELVFTNTAPTNGLIALIGGNTVGTLEFKAGGELRGNNTITNLLLAPSESYIFRNTQTVNGLFRFNSPGCDGLGELRGIASESSTLHFGPSSALDFNNVYLQNMIATGKGVPITVSGADAGGNTGFNITASASGPRYWVGGSGDWNDAAHWSATSGGPGGACVPTVANDVFFDANSFTSGSSTVTISQYNAYCRNMDWTGAAFVPVFSKPSNLLTMEIWGNVILNPAVTMNAQLLFTGATNGTFTSNGSTLGNLDIVVIKPVGNKLSFADNHLNNQTKIDLRYGGLDLTGRTLSLEGITDVNVADPTNLNITNATVTVAIWEYQGNAKSLQATGSTVNAGSWFTADGGTYNNVNIGTTLGNQIYIATTTFNDLVFTNPSTSSGARIVAGNTIGRLEFKGRGAIGGTGNTIGTLIFSPGKVYTFAAGSNTTITTDWFGSGTPCNPTEITSVSSTATVTKTAGEVEFDYVRLRGITAAGVTPFKALEHSEDLGNNTNWDIAPYNGSTPILGLGPDVTLCANGFPYTLNTDGFFASPLASFAWNDGSTQKTLTVTAPGTYSVTVSYPDGCSRTDNIVITRSEVPIAPITGTANVCTGRTTTLATTTAGGTWSTSDAAIATVNATGVVTGLAPGTVTITYTVTNGDGCTASQAATVTVNAVPPVNDITGTLTVFQGSTTTLGNTTAGGVWSSSNTAVATVSNTGVVSGVAPGTAHITYRVTSPQGCDSARTVTVTVDGFTPDQRVLSVTKTADAGEPSSNGGFLISLPASVNAEEDITITYTIGGTAGAADYTPLSGTAIIAAGQHGVSLPVTVADDNLVENTETVTVTLTAATGTAYAYTLSTTNGNAALNITDNENTTANHVLEVTNAANANEGGTQGRFRISLPAGAATSEDITVSYTIGGTATNGTDYNTLTGTVVIPAGQPGASVFITTINDQIVEGAETATLTLTGGTTATIGNFTASPTQGSATVAIADDDNTAANRTLSVSAIVHGAEGGANGSFTIGLPSGITAVEPVTVNYTVTGTAVGGTDYTALSGTALIPAGQPGVVVPVVVTDDALVEAGETVIVTINNGTSATFAFTASATAGSGTVNIADNDNIAANRVISITKTTDAAEPGTNGVFRVSLPAGVLASEDIRVNYSVTGTATPGTDYNALTDGFVIIDAGTNGTDIPVNVIDNSVIETTENVVITLGSTSGTGLAYTISPTAGNATVNITDNDFAGNANVVLLTKISDAIEGGANGQYRVSFQRGVTSSQDVVVTFTTTASGSGIATRNTDYTILGLTGGNIVIPAGANEVFIDIDAGNDGIIEGPERVELTLTNASSAGYPFVIDAANSSATVNIVDANAASSTPIQVQIAPNTGAAEPSTNATFTVKLAGVAESAWPVTVAYRLSGSAIAGLDYESFGTITIPPSTNAVPVTLRVKDDKIIEPTEEMTITILSGSATDGGGNAFIFPPDPVYENISVNIADNDATVANRVLSVAKAHDAAEPSTDGAYTVSLPAGYSSSANITLTYNMTGSAARGPDYNMYVVTLPAYSNSITLPVRVNDDKIIEGTETAVMNLTVATDGNSFTYSANPAANGISMNIADDDLTAANTVLSVTNDGNAAEPGTDGAFKVSLPAGITCATAITLNYTIGGTAVTGAGGDYDALPATLTIPAGQNSIPVPVTVQDDQFVENTETVTFTINSGTAGSISFTPAGSSSQAVVNITDNENTPANKVISIAAATNATEGTANVSSFTISLPANVRTPEAITVAYTLGGTALDGTDYAGLSGTAVIPAGQSSVVISAPAIDDQIIEGNETVVVTLTGATSNGFSWTISTTAGSATSTIIDNDNTPANRTLTVTKVTDGVEPATDGMFRISLPANVRVAGDVTVNYAVTGTAMAGADYTALTGIAVIPAGQTGVNVRVAMINDQLIEPTETVILTLAGGTGAGFGFSGTGSATLNITDDESGVPANLGLTISKMADGAEPLTNGGFSISLRPGITLAQDVTVTYTITGTATAGTDYAALSGTAVIPAGQPSVSIPVTVTDDQLIELTETVTATLTGGSGGGFTFTGTGNATVNITDNESAASLALTVSKGADGAEPAANGSFSIRLPAGVFSTEDVTVNYTMGGTAAAGSDYTAIAATAVIPAGQNGVTIPVAIINDQVIEPTETVTLTLAGGKSTHFTFTGSGTATVNIADDESAAPANLVLTIANGGHAAEPGTPGLITISLPTGISVSEDVMVNYTVAGTAIPGTDYAALTGTAVIPAGQGSVSIPVAVIDDQLIEGMETAIVTLNGGISTNFNFTGSGNATVNIADDDNVPANLVLQVTAAANAAEPSKNGTFNIALPQGLSATEDITVNYVISGTAMAGQDHSLYSGTVVIPAGDNNIAVPVTVTDDQLIENTESVIISLNGGSSRSFTFTGSGTATMEIADDDNTPENLVLSIAKTADGAEPGTNGGFSIGFPAGVAVAEDVTVQYTVAGSATAGADYTALSGSVTIPAGQNSIGLPVTVMNDATLEGTETVIATLTGGSSSSFTFTGNGNAIVNVTDDEAVPANLVLNAVKGADAAEPGTNGHFTVKLPGSLTASVPVTVNYTITGTATNGTDYTLMSGRAVIPAGENSVNIPVTVTDDVVIDGDETVVLTITGGNTTSGLNFTAGTNAALTIADNDDDQVNVVAAAGAQASESTTNGAFSISLEGGKTALTNVAVTYAISGTATAGSDYTALTGTAVIPAGSNSVAVPVSVLDDELIEAAETVIIRLSGATATGLTVNIGAGSATVNINDNDNADLGLQVAASIPAAAEPATHGEFTISLPKGKRTAEAITVQYTISGTATGGADYTALTGTATIPAGQQAVTIPVQVIDDETVELPETVQIRITGGQSAAYTYTAGNPAQAEVTITSEDVAGDLLITKEIVQPATGPYRLGQDITYRIRVTNIGAGMARGVVVTDSLAMQLAPPSRTNTDRGQVSVSLPDKALTWTIGDMAPGASAFLEVTCRITEGGQLTAPAIANSDTRDTDESNNKAALAAAIQGSDLLFPNVMTPNGDGKNERFVIGGLEKYQGAKLQVFNRWGSQVYRSNDYRNDWNGSGLNEGTYYYILEVQKADGAKTYKGWVLIVR